MNRQLRKRMAVVQLVDNTTSLVTEHEDHLDWFRLRGLVKKAQDALKAGDLHAAVHSCFAVCDVLQPDDDNHDIEVNNGNV